MYKRLSLAIVIGIGFFFGPAIVQNNTFATTVDLTTTNTGSMGATLLLNNTLRIGPAIDIEPQLYAQKKRVKRSGNRNVSRNRNVNRNVNRNININRNVNVTVRHRGYGWRGVRWGAVVFGVALGTAIVVAVNTPPYPPDPSLCWTWSNSTLTRGYWYYCSGP